MSLTFLDNKQWFSVLNSVVEHDRVVSITQKNFRARDAVKCSNALSAGNHPGVLKTVLSTLNHCSLRLDNSHKCHFLPSCSVWILSMSKNQSDHENIVMNCLADFTLCFICCPQEKSDMRFIGKRIELRNYNRPKS